MTHPLSLPPKWSPGLAYQALSMYSVEKYVKRCLLVLANFHHLLFTSCSRSHFTVLEATENWVGPGLALYSVSIPFHSWGPWTGLSLSLVPDGPFQGVLHSWCSSTAGRRHQAHWKWVSREYLREGGGGEGRDIKLTENHHTVPVVVHLLFDSSPIVPTILP